MQYLAILGRQPELGLIELESLLGADAVSPFGRHALIKNATDLARIGSVVKLAKIINRIPIQPLNKLSVPLDLLPTISGKLTFAISAYNVGNIDSVTQLGLAIKRQLRISQPVRLVMPKTPASALTAAQLKYNNLPEAGFELIIASDGHELVLALLEQFQDIDAYSARDHGRPARDAAVGMLPPKLAQLLINTTHSSSIYDPFCGTGVILQEALLSGRVAHGSDLAEAMVTATETNLAWLKNTDVRQWPPSTVSVADAASVTLPAGTAIVSEGYLGPNQQSRPSSAEISELVTKLSGLYRSVLTNFANQLNSGAEVSICLPAWRTSSGWQSLQPIIDELASLGYTNKVFRTTDEVLRYARPDQIVGRQLLLLTRN